MKTALALTLALFSASAFAQDTTPLTHAMAACGPLNVHFDAKISSGVPAAQPEPGKALVYVAEDFGRISGPGLNPTIRIGLDGSWLGATRASSYLSFAVEPGEHHLCATWQSSLGRLSKLAAFVGFTAEPGKVYYFRTRIEYGSTVSFDLEPVDADEGQYLVALFQPSTSHPKK